MVKYCPICNRSSDEARFFGEFCEYCTRDMLLKKIPDMATIYTCRFCGRIKAGPEYMQITKESLRSALHLSINDCTFAVEDFNIVQRFALLRFFCYEGELTFTKRIKLKILHKTCTECYRKRSGYYEAVVQLRGNPEKIERMRSKIRAYVEKGGGFVSKEEPVKNGIDMYISSKELVNSFVSYHKLKPKRSFELYGLKRGRKLYRNIYALIFE